jgi:hypothetical protein
MERRRVARLLQFFMTAVCLGSSALIAVMWLRNFWWADVVWAPLPGAGQLVIASADGQCEFGVSYPVNRWGTRALRTAPSWGFATYTASQNRAVDVVVPWNTVIRYRFDQNGDIAVWLPHWLLVLAPLLFAGAFWIHWSRRFTIRTMLVVTTLVAVLLALATTAGE